MYKCISVVGWGCLGGPCLGVGGAVSLTTVSQQEERPIRQILYLGNLLETCHFQSFWVRYTHISWLYVFNSKEEKRGVAEREGNCFRKTGKKKKTCFAQIIHLNCRTGCCLSILCALQLLHNIWFQCCKKVSDTHLLNLRDRNGSDAD